MGNGSTLDLERYTHITNFGLMYIIHSKVTNPMENQLKLHEIKKLTICQTLTKVCLQGLKSNKFYPVFKSTFSIFIKTYYLFKFKKSYH